MKQSIFFLFVTALISACGNEVTEASAPIEATDTTKLVAATIQDTTPKIIGIGGIFFESSSPQDISAWYGENLGMAIDEYGSPFEFRNANRPEEINYLRWSPFKEGTDFAAPSEKQFIVNYRVQNIEGLVRQLRNNSVTILDSIAEYPYGKFVHIMDPEGNKIELWEPIDSFLTEMGGETTK